MKTRLSKMLNVCDTVDLCEETDLNAPVYEPVIGFMDPEGKHIRLEIGDLVWDFHDQDIEMQFDGVRSFAVCETFDGDNPPEKVMLTFWKQSPFTPSEVVEINSLE